MKRKAIFLLYRVLQALVSPVFLIYLLSRSLRSGAWLRSLPERFGALPPSWQQTVAGAIWFHAVSVGEVLTAAPLLEELRARTPRTPLFVSVGTLAGREAAEKRIAHFASGIFFVPFDFVWSIRRVLRRLKPSVVVIVETEIWPNLFREANRVGCGLLIVNGRISDRALARYMRWRFLFRAILPLCTRILTQSPTMRNRFIAIGAPERITESAGNLKYCSRPSPAAAPAVKRFLSAAHARLWIAASTSADNAIEEEDFVIAAQREMPGWRLILAPRKPERFDDVARKLEKSGLRFTRRTVLDDPPADVLLLDSVGELSGLFAFADAVFMGGTLAAKGGHNILEPAAFGKPIVAGPHLENFADIESAFESAHALIRIRDGGELRDAILRAADNPDLGVRARHAAESQRGADKRCAAAIVAIHDSSWPRRRPPQPTFAILWFLAELWRYFSARDRRKKLGRMKRLPVPVVSVGNITAGGTGKTPVTIELLRAFESASPGLLTRGHGRSTDDMLVASGSGAVPPIELTGDEAQLYLRSVHAPIAIAGERYTAGLELLKEFSPRIIFLDDGFQHLQLARDFDLVLIDALNPLGHGYLIPLGRLREPLGGLARASAFLITHSDEVPSTHAIESILRSHNASAPIFKACTRPVAWRDSEGNTFELTHFAAARSLAFCGLGNPESFWRSLGSIGIHPIDRQEYGDHHRYPPAEIVRLARHAIEIGVDVFLTTAKDSVNLPPGYESLIAPLRLYWLEIRIEIDGREELIRLINKILNA